MKFHSSRLAVAAATISALSVADAKVVAFSNNGAKPELELRVSKMSNPGENGGELQKVTIDSGSFHHLVLKNAEAKEVRNFMQGEGKAKPKRAKELHKENEDALNAAHLHWKVKVEHAKNANQTGLEWIDLADSTEDYVADYRKPGQKTEAGRQALIGLPAMRMMNLQIGVEGNKLARWSKNPDERPVVLVRPPHGNETAGADTDKIFLNARIQEDGTEREFCMVLDTGGPVSSLPDFAVAGDMKGVQLKNAFDSIKKGHVQAAGAAAEEERPLVKHDLAIRLKTTETRRFSYTPKTEARGGLYPLVEAEPAVKKVFKGGVQFGANGRRGNLSVRSSNNKDRIEQGKNKSSPPKYWGILGMPFITDVQPHLLYLEDDKDMKLSYPKLAKKYFHELRVLGMSSEFLNEVINEEAEIRFLRTTGKQGCKNLYETIRSGLPNADSWNEV